MAQSSSKRTRSYSSTLSAWLLIVFMLSIFPSKYIPEINITFSDLVVHFVLYAVTGSMFFIVFRKSGFSVLKTHPALMAILLAALYGLGMEVAQIFSPGRTFSLWDVAANTFGAVFAVSILTILTRNKIPETVKTRTQEINNAGKDN